MGIRKLTMAQLCKLREYIANNIAVDYYSDIKYIGVSNQLINYSNYYNDVQVEYLIKCRENQYMQSMDLFRLDIEEFNNIINN